MAKHVVTITKIPTTLVGRADVIFEVRKDNVKLGDLRVSQGNLFWRPKNNSYGYVLNWDNFSDIAAKKGTRIKYNY